MCRVLWLYFYIISILQFITVKWQCCTDIIIVITIIIINMILII